MNYKGTEIPKPQTEESIEECKWVAAKDLPSYLENTYPSIIEVFQKANINLSE